MEGGAKEDATVFGRNGMKQFGSISWEYSAGDKVSIMLLIRVLQNTGATCFNSISEFLI